MILSTTSTPYAAGPEAWDEDEQEPARGWLSYLWGILAWLAV